MLIVMSTVSKCSVQFQTKYIKSVITPVPSNGIMLAADNAPRGLDFKMKNEIKRWFDSPSFLW